LATLKNFVIIMHQGSLFVCFKCLFISYLPFVYFDKEMPIVCKAAATISFDPKLAKNGLQ